MGYSTRHGTSITDYWPDDGENHFYIKCYGALDVQDVLSRCKEKWGEDIDIGKLCISPEYIHTECLYYDQYDGGDYTNFWLISYNP